MALLAMAFTKSDDTIPELAGRQNDYERPAACRLFGRSMRQEKGRGALVLWHKASPT